MVDFVVEWYNKFINSTNEKDLLIAKLSYLLEGEPKSSCLEIGLGISPHFSEKLSTLFKNYTIIEKRAYTGDLPRGVKLILGDWEELEIKERFDVILASHIICYFSDKRKAVHKIISSLKKDGKIYFVVNGKNSDYGSLKLAFSKITNSKYEFTYDTLMLLLKGKKIKEYTLPSVIRFNSYEDLFETLRIPFSSHPKVYETNKEKLIGYFKKNLNKNKFTMDQKLIEVMI